MKKAIYIFAALMLSLAGNANPPGLAPFRMPVGARVLSHGRDFKGWQESGEIGVTFAAARSQFLSCVAASGWRLRHTIPMGEKNDRAIITWRRGGRELTIMLWRIDVDRTGFSWGVSTEE